MQRFREAEQVRSSPLSLCIIALMLATLMGYFLLGLIRLLTGEQARAECRAGPGNRAIHMGRV